VLDAVGELRDGLQGRGVTLKEIAGGWTLASDPSAEDAARRLLSDTDRVIGLHQGASEEGAAKSTATQDKSKGGRPHAGR